MVETLSQYISLQYWKSTKKLGRRKWYKLLLLLNKRWPTSKASVIDYAATSQQNKAI